MWFLIFFIIDFFFSLMFAINADLNMLLHVDVSLLFLADALKEELFQQSGYMLTSAGIGDKVGSFSVLI